MTALRLVTGWFFLYAGLSKIINPTWSAGGYLSAAKSFSGFYGWLASPGILPIVNFINEWGLFLIGLSLILGVAVKLSGYLGSVMMLLYYLPVLDFPKVDHGFIVDDHIIFIAVLLLLAAFDAGRVYGLETWFKGVAQRLKS